MKPHLRLYNGKWVTAERAARMALIDSLQVGDLIRWHGNLRIVRDIGRKPKRSPAPVSQVYSIGFAIRRCSWTRRPYTYVSRFDMYRGDLQVVRRGYGADRTPLGKRLQEEIESMRGTCNRGMSCHDVAQVIA